MTLQILFNRLFLIFLFIFLYACNEQNNNLPHCTTVNELRKEVLSEKDCYKIVFLYDSSCGQCERHFNYMCNTFDKNENIDSIKYYLVSLSKYWTLPDTSFNNFVHKNNVNTYIDTNNSAKSFVKELVTDTSIFLHNGTPYTIIFSPDNKILKSICNIDDTIVLFLTNTADLNLEHLSEIDFSKPLNLIKR